MKISTPEISWHGRDPIYSLDFQHQESPGVCRLATAGTDRNVRLWTVKRDDEGKGTVEFLSCLSRHTRTVNVVRFSPDGSLLASAGDDSAILLWRQSSNPPSGNNLFQDEEDENKETWTVIKTLRSHLEDVYDLSWAKDGKHLLSGSVDNTAILWDIKKGQKLWIFTEHKSFVQGVAFDPLNQFMATLCSDRSLRIYNFKSRCCVHNVKKITMPNNNNAEKPKSSPLFHDDTLKSFFRRLSFSPDGQLLATPSGFLDKDGDQPALSATFLFTRTCLNKPAVYLPSRTRATLATRFCPVYFELRKKAKGTSKSGVVDKDDSSRNGATETETEEKPKSLFGLPYRLVLAVATEDSVLLYDTQQNQPFAYIGNIHYHQLSDLSWSHDGRTLGIASTDGYCTLVTFAEGELGVRHTDQHGPKPSESEVKDLQNGFQEAVKVNESVPKRVAKAPPKPAPPGARRVALTTLIEKPEDVTKDSAGPVKAPRRVQITTLTSATGDSSSSEPSTSSSKPPRRIQPTTLTTLMPETSADVCSGSSASVMEVDCEAGVSTGFKKSVGVEKKPRRVAITTLQTFEEEPVQATVADDSIANTTVSEESSFHLVLETSLDESSEKLENKSANHSEIPSKDSNADQTTTPVKSKSGDKMISTPTSEKPSSLENVNVTPVNPKSSVKKLQGSVGQGTPSPRRVATVLLGTPKTSESSK